MHFRLRHVIDADIRYIDAHAPSLSFAIDATAIIAQLISPLLFRPPDIAAISRSRHAACFCRHYQPPFSACCAAIFASHAIAIDALRLFAAVCLIFSFLFLQPAAAIIFRIFHCLSAADFVPFSLR